MTYTLVVGAVPVAGANAFYRDLLARATHVVAADAGGEWCIGLGRVPDVTVGDFDSAAVGAAERLAAAGTELVTHPRDKEFTDLELAVALAQGRWADPIVLTAAFSRRVDHTLAALGTLLRAGHGASVREPGWYAYACVPGGPLDLKVATGATVSVLSIGPASGVTVSGVRWPLRVAALDALSGLGVSNRAVEDVVHVSVEVGSLIVMVPEVDT